MFDDFIFLTPPIRIKHTGKGTVREGKQKMEAYFFEILKYVRNKCSFYKQIT